MPSRRCPICSCSCRVGGPDTSRFVSGCRRHKGRAFGSLWALLLSFRDPDGACEQPTARGQSSQDQPAREPRRAAHEASAARQSGQRQRRTTPLRRRRSHSANRHGHMPPDRTRWPLRSTGPHGTSAAHRRAHVRTFARTREPEGGAAYSQVGCGQPQLQITPTALRVPPVPKSENILATHFYLPANQHLSDTGPVRL
jgi:hypothetical protein